MNEITQSIAQLEAQKMELNRQLQLLTQALEQLHRRLRELSAPYGDYVADWSVLQSSASSIAAPVHHAAW